MTLAVTTGAVGLSTRWAPLACRSVTAPIGVEPVAEARTLDQRFADGDQAALREVYDHHGALVLGFCRRRLDEDAALDVTQEVFVAAWRSRHRFDPARGPLAAWLMAIAKNKIVDLYRYRSRRPEQADQSVPERAGEEEQSIERMAERMLLAQAMAELPERARTVVALSFYEQLTHGEIAERTGLPLGTVKSDIRRSLLKLRTQIDTGLDIEEGGPS